MLFDIKNDPREITDLAAGPELKPVVERMMKLLRSEQEKYGDDLPLLSENPRSAEFIPPPRNRQKPPNKGGIAPAFQR